MKWEDISFQNALGYANVLSTAIKELFVLIKLGNFLTINFYEKDNKSVGLEKKDAMTRADGEWELERLLPG